MQRNQDTSATPPSEVLLHIFSFLNNSEHCAIRQTSKEFKRLIDQLYSNSWSSLSEEERLIYLIKLCLEISALKKSNRHTLHEVRCARILEVYLEKTNISMLSSALAHTALAMLYIHTTPAPEKITACENQLRFVLKMLSAHRSSSKGVLIDVLIAMIKKKQGDFCSYLEITMDPFFVNTGITLDDEHNDVSKKIYRTLIQEIPFPIDYETHISLQQKIQSALQSSKSQHYIRFLIDHLKNNWQAFSADEANKLIDLLSKELNNPLYPAQFSLTSLNQDNALKMLLALWPQLPEEKKDQLFNDIMSMIEKSSVAHPVIASINHLTAKNREAIYAYSINCLKNDNNLILSIQLLSAISSYLSQEQQHELEGYIQNIPEDDFFALPLRWHTLTEEKQSALLENLIESNCAIKSDVLLELKNKKSLTAEQNNTILEYFIRTYENTAEYNPSPASLLDAIWLFANSASCEINLILANKHSELISAFTLTDHHDFTFQSAHIGGLLIHIGRFEISLQERCDTAKKAIHYFCQQALNLQDLRELKNQFEQLHSIQEFAYLAKRQHHFSLSISLHQWTSTQHRREHETYHCSKEWIECMAIFQKHMLPYEKEWTEEDKHFMQLSGSGWQDWKVNFSK